MNDLIRYFQEDAEKYLSDKKLQSSVHTSSVAFRVFFSGLSLDIKGEDKSVFRFQLRIETMSR